MDDVPGELIDHLTRVSPLDARQARRCVEEVLAYFSESLEAFVARRHGELRAEGLANPVIYRALAAELARRRFPAPALSERQIRRLIYG